MLIMLIMLIFLGTLGPPPLEGEGGGGVQKGQKINMINISPVLSTFRAKSA